MSEQEAVKVEETPQQQNGEAADDAKVTEEGEGEQTAASEEQKEGEEQTEGGEQAAGGEQTEGEEQTEGGEQAEGEEQTAGGEEQGQAESTEQEAANQEETQDPVSQTETQEETVAETQEEAGGEEKQGEGQTEEQTEGQPEEQTEGQAEEQTGQAEEQTGQTEQTEGQTEEQTEGQTEEQTEGQTEEQTEGQTEEAQNEEPAAQQEEVVQNGDVGDDDPEIKYLRKKFDCIASNGRISFKQFNHVMRLVGQNKTFQESRQIYDNADLDGDGTIDFNEFCRLYKDNMTSDEAQEAELTECINKMFPGQTEFVQLDKVRQVITNIPTLGREESSLSPDDLDSIIEKMDVNGDKKISKTEFTKMLLSRERSNV